MSVETRETILFLAGLASFAYVLLVPSAPKDVSILILIAGMMGIPAVLPVDRKRNGETLRQKLPGDNEVRSRGGVPGNGRQDS